MFVVERFTIGPWGYSYGKRTLLRTRSTLRAQRKLADAVDGAMRRLRESAEWKMGARDRGGFRQDQAAVIEKDGEHHVYRVRREP